MRIGIYIYNESEVLDFSGPFEVFSTANRLAEGVPPFDVFFISEMGGRVVARGGMTIVSDYSIDDHPPLDMLIVVGGDHRAELSNKKVLDWIAESSSKVELLVSVCTGVFILAKAGVILDQTVTTHWEDIEDLRKSFPQLDVVTSKRWVEDGRLVSSGGISAGIDMSLHLVERIIGGGLASRTARQMEYNWNGEYSTE